MVEWEILAAGVWLLRGIPEDGVIGLSPSEFTVVAVDQGGGIVKLMAGERLDSHEKRKALHAALKGKGFTRAYAMRNGKQRWYR